MLSRVYRFHGLGSLRALYKRARVVRSPYVSLKYAANERRTASRVAVVVGRKVSKAAVVRNRIRRRVYEAVRRRMPAFQPSHAYDLSFVVYDERLSSLPADELQKTVDRLLKQSGVTQKGSSQPQTTPANHDIVKNKSNGK